MKRAALLCALALAGGACGSPGTSPGSPTPSPSVATATTGTITPDPSSGTTTATPAAVPASADETTSRLRLDDRYEIFFCDPDEHPVGVDDRTRKQRGREWYAQNKDTPEAHAIRTHHGYREPLTDEQIQVVYEDHKRLRAISMERVANGWRFELLDGDGSKADAVRGTITADGAIAEASRSPAQPTCPICLEPGAAIDTPSGPVAAAAIRPGDLVWSAGHAGRRVAVRVVRVVRRPVPSPHLMVRITLRDGRSVTAAPSHPDASGTALWSLRSGDPLDGSVVERVDLFASRASATVDLLPAGTTGAYWANGVLLGSTIR